MSFYDELNSNLAPVIRNLKDVTLQQTGTKVNVLRLTTDAVNMFGDQDQSYADHIIQDVVINYPFGSSVDLLSAVGQAETNVGAIYITDLLPITMELGFSGSIDVEFDRDDIIVDVFFDHKETKIPIILTAPKEVGSFNGKHLVSKKFELTLYRGKLEADIQSIVDGYISTVTHP